MFFIPLMHGANMEIPYLPLVTTFYCHSSNTIIYLVFTEPSLGTSVPLSNFKTELIFIYSFQYFTYFYPVPSLGMSGVTSPSPLYATIARTRVTLLYSYVIYHDSTVIFLWYHKCFIFIFSNNKKTSKWVTNTQNLLLRNSVV